MKQVCDGGLPASATAIHGHNSRSVMTLSISVENQMDNVTDRRYSPWTRRRLPGAKLHVHVKILFLVDSLRGQLILSFSDVMPVGVIRTFVGDDGQSAWRLIQRQA
jgi:hypothetical protein